MGGLEFPLSVHPVSYLIIIITRQNILLYSCTKHACFNYYAFSLSLSLSLSPSLPTSPSLPIPPSLSLSLSLSLSPSLPLYTLQCKSVCPPFVWSEWTPCSQACGHGHRYRKAVYQFVCHDNHGLCLDHKLQVEGCGIPCQFDPSKYGGKGTCTCTCMCTCVNDVLPIKLGKWRSTYLHTITGNAEIFKWLLFRESRPSYHQEMFASKNLLLWVANHITIMQEGTVRQGHVRNKHV